MENPGLFEEIRHAVAECNPEALLADGFEDALLGTVQRCSQALACYDYDKCVDILMKRDGMTEEDAVAYLDFNTLGAWAGENTPMFLFNVRRTLGAFHRKAGSA